MWVSQRRATVELAPAQITSVHHFRAAGVVAPLETYAKQMAAQAAADAIKRSDGRVKSKRQLDEEGDDDDDDDDEEEENGGDGDDDDEPKAKKAKATAPPSKKAAKPAPPTATDDDDVRDFEDDFSDEDDE